MLSKALISLSFLFAVTVTHAQRDTLYIVSFDDEEIEQSIDEELLASGAEATKVDSLLSYANGFLGTRYKFGSCGTSSFDCSGFVKHVYGMYGVDIPHGSTAQAQLCEDVKLKKVKPGDLLFFSGRKISKSNIGHVAIVKEVNGNSITMIHATVQAGVIIESLENSEYFSKRFIKAGRIVQPDEGKKRG